MGFLITPKYDQRILCITKAQSLNFIVGARYNSIAIIATETDIIFPIKMISIQMEIVDIVSSTQHFFCPKILVVIFYNINHITNNRCQVIIRLSNCYCFSTERINTFKSLNKIWNRCVDNPYFIYWLQRSELHTDWSRWLRKKFGFKEPLFLLACPLRHYCLGLLCPQHYFSSKYLMPHSHLH